MTSEDYRIEIGGDREDAFAVRKRVFVHEQGVDPDIEIDEHEDESTHVVAYAEGPVGTVRLREPKDGVGKVERLAVLDAHRKRGLGRRLMETVEDIAGKRGLTRLKLHSQTRVAGFYEHLGYERVGEQFEEANISHVLMVKDLQ